MTQKHQLVVDSLSAGYGDKTILEDITLKIAPGQITSIIGANACGKSTLLRTMSRLLTPSKGQVLLDGKSIHKSPTRQLAQTLGLLPQSPTAPEGITVGDLVSRGRYPHQRLMSRWNKADDEAVAKALETTQTTELLEKDVDELSGGQRQRVWIAMALAQETEILLLDEPTTFLDVAHQIEVLDLLVDLNKSRGTTIVLVLHDLNLAARYSDQLIAMQQGRVFTYGTATQVITEATVQTVFGLNNQIVSDPISGSPMVLPIGRHKNTTL
ncbi:MULTISPECIES: ABC transporter ATP-binding protein [Marinomonas]|uniref:ABC transporter ATP-binding protein n=1 Tax=Marinomonas arctica TaxID=383750 RepID=A0A7H1J9T5_9GAMM|nr:MULTISPECIES: ABC transporter ATP-binding protein [Marinomonas]MCS7485371.1 iron dicitrate ABC transporter ATP-binding protein [Marinomonas sp. BSi20414]QNT07251.1 ABC transporter ATP-binding protein [Marinomonas arctica]GGN24876.1 iron-dicitrate ABC transporter ATP-binding protein [Marinomonas arctica]